MIVVTQDQIDAAVKHLADIREALLKAGLEPSDELTLEVSRLAVRRCDFESLMIGAGGPVGVPVGYDEASLPPGCPPLSTSDLPEGSPFQAPSPSQPLDALVPLVKEWLSLERKKLALRKKELELSERELEQDGDGWK